MPWIASPEGRAARALAGQLLASFPKDPLAAGTGLRRAMPELSAQDASLAIVQAQLSQIAEQRYGIQAEELLFTRDGLEQATRPEIAQSRARLIASTGAGTVIDLTAGLGFDTRAFLAAGLDVVAVEREPVTADYLRVNAPAAQVLQGDATQLADELLHRFPQGAVFFLDPARRAGQRTLDGTRAQSERDPQRWSPPWSFVTDLARKGAVVCAKLAPGFDPGLMPPGWSGIWTSMLREPIEAMLCSWSLPAPRVSCAIGAQSVEFAGTGIAPALLGPIRQWIHEPDPSLEQAHLLDDFCATHSALTRLDASGAWLTSEAPVRQSMLRSFEVLGMLPNDTRALRRELSARGIGELTIKCRGMKIDADALRRELRLPTGAVATIVILRALGARSTLLVHEHS